MREQKKKTEEEVPEISIKLINDEVDNKRNQTYSLEETTIEMIQEY